MTQSTLKASAASWKPAGSNDGKEAKPAAQTTQAQPKTSTLNPGASVWGKKPSEAIRKAAPAPRPAPPAQTQTNQKTNSNNGWRRGVKQQQDSQDGDKSNWSRGNRGHDGGGRGGGRGRGGRHNRNNRGDRDKNNNEGGGDGGWARGKSLPVELLKPGEGTTPAQKEIIRITVEELLGMRMSFVAPPLLWTEQPDVAPTEPALWKSETRVSEIDAMHKAPRMAGDVSSNNKRRNQQKDKNDTAPPLEECAPLEVNEETRWKASVFIKDKKDDSEVESDEDVLKKALLVLNKLSLTKFDKLSDAFIDTGIGRNEECLKQAISLVVNKAQSEPHFSNMYASLCLKLGRTPMEALGEEGKKKGKKFKKLLLERCQQEFEEDTAHKIARVTENITDPEEKEYHANIIRKNYLGHMRFIGELYKGDMIRIGIMLFCLYDLLGMPTDEFLSKDNDDKEDDIVVEDTGIDEEKVECFAKLMTTIGDSLEQQAQAANESGKTAYLRQLGDCWKTTEDMAKKEKKDTKPRISNRIKYMLQDLIELRNKGWITRRKEETAKTIEQIHKEVAKEERAARRSGSSGNLRAMGSKGNSSSNLHNLERSKSSSSTTDADGFTTVKSSGISRSFSSNSLRRSSSDGFSQASWSKTKKDDSKIKRSSSGGGFSALRDGSSQKGGKKASSSKADKPKPPQDAGVEAAAAKTSEPAKVYKDPAACGKSSVNILKEYFVGGDTDDAVLSIFELVGPESEADAVQRGVSVVESSCGHVLESKAEDVDKYIVLLTRCAQENKLSTNMVQGGLAGLLEFISDIMIDAPLAGTHMVRIVATLVKENLLQLDFLLTTPEYFRTDGNAAQFAAKVMKEVGALEEVAYLEIVEKLMTEEDKKSHDSAKALVGSV